MSALPPELMGGFDAVENLPEAMAGMHAQQLSSASRSDGSGFKGD
ncbi:MAG: hypothetical protein CM15mP77_2930 [Synechococcus sp.]|nr:MAG: hypothetical protein CM15mP77_2930 [Synechococcus sp.]